MSKARELPVDGNSGDGPSDPNRLNPAEVGEEFAESIQNALGNVGLFNADEITAERLAKANPEILRKLTPQTAESLYFDTFRQSRLLIGIEPIKLHVLINQARSYHRQGVDLEKLQLTQREKDLSHLHWAKISPLQLLQLASASEGKKQNINRLGFFLFDTPALKEYAKYLHEEGPEDGWSIEETVINTQEILKARNYQWDELNSSNYGNLSFLQQQAHGYHLHRLGSVYQIGETILEEMRDTSFQQFTAGADPFED